jgi:hypothetical protein
MSNENKNCEIPVSVKTLSQRERERERETDTQTRTPTHRETHTCRRGETCSRPRWVLTEAYLAVPVVCVVEGILKHKKSIRLCLFLRVCARASKFSCVCVCVCVCADRYQ